MNIYVFGSLAFDTLMAFGRPFSDVILPDKLDNLNVCFFIEHMVRRRGGTAGNIAYSLSLLGERPVILSSAGRDFVDYAGFLESRGMPLHGIRIVPEEFTASCGIVTDPLGNQLSTFHPAAMGYSCRPDLSEAVPGDILIVSPGMVEDMRALPAAAKRLGMFVIYDPGQQIPVLGKQDLLEGFGNADIAITNEYELDMVSRATGRTAAELRGLAGTLITTLGGDGVSINNGEMRLPPVPPKEMRDPTGAGDAFRSGLIKGLSLGLSIEASARIGTLTATYCVELDGTQEHSYTMEEFSSRYLAEFGEALPWR